MYVIRNIQANYSGNYMTNQLIFTLVKTNMIYSYFKNFIRFLHLLDK